MNMRIGARGTERVKVEPRKDKELAPEEIARKQVPYARLLKGVYKKGSFRDYLCLTRHLGS